MNKLIMILRTITKARRAILAVIGLVVVLTIFATNGCASKKIEKKEEVKLNSPQNVCLMFGKAIASKNYKKAMSYWYFDNSSINIKEVENYIEQWRKSDVKKVELDIPSNIKVLGKKDTFTRVSLNYYFYNSQNKYIVELEEYGLHKINSKWKITEYYYLK